MDEEGQKRQPSMIPEEWKALRFTAQKDDGAKQTALQLMLQQCKQIQNTTIDVDTETKLRQIIEKIMELQNIPQLNIMVTADTDAIYKQEDNEPYDPKYISIEAIHEHKVYKDRVIIHLGNFGAVSFINMHQTLKQAFSKQEQEIDITINFDDMNQRWK